MTADPMPSGRQLLAAMDGRDRRIVALVTLAFAVFITIHALVTPLHRGPDETQHHDMVIHVFEQQSWPDPGDRFIELAIRRSRDLTMWQLRDVRREQAEAQPRAERPTWNELEIATADGEQHTGGRNPASQHPFLYYTLLAVPWGILQSAVVGLAHDQAVVALRLVNLLFVLPMPLLTLLTARRLGCSTRTAHVATVLIAAVPQLVHVGGLVNNDNLLNPLGFLFLFVLAGVLRGRNDLRTAAMLGVVTGLGLLTKGFALMWLPLIAIAYVWSGRDRLRRIVGPGVVALATAMVVGGWWWVRNRIVYGVVQPQPLLWGREGPGAQTDLDRWWQAFGVRFLDGFWGRFGTLDAEFPRWAILCFWVVLIGLVGLGAWAWRQRRDSSRAGLLDLVLLGGLTGGLAVLLVYESLTTYLREGFAVGMQGRYLYVGLSVVLVLAAVGVDRLAHRRATVAAAIAAAIIQLGGLAVVLESWYGPRTGSWTPWAAIRSLGTWLVWHPFLVLVILGAVIVAVALIFPLSGDRPRRDRLTRSGSP